MDHRDGLSVIAGDHRVPLGNNSTSSTERALFDAVIAIVISFGPCDPTKDKTIGPVFGVLPTVRLNGINSDT